MCGRWAIAAGSFDNPICWLDVSQKLTAICVVHETGRRLWRCQDWLETGPMTPWPIHDLRGRGHNITCLDARHARAARKMQVNKTGQNDAVALAIRLRSSDRRS